MGFGTRLLSWKYRMRSVKSDWAFACRSFMFSTVTISVVSSAYVYTFDWTVLMILLMYSRKSVVDSVLPWGMPCVITCMSDCACVVCVDWCLFLKYDSKNVAVSSEKLNSVRSLVISFSWDTVSYALDKST